MQLVKTGGAFTSAIDANGQLWQWGYDQAGVIFGKGLVHTGYGSNYFDIPTGYVYYPTNYTYVTTNYIWKVGGPYPPGEPAGYPCRMLVPGPVKCEIPLVANYALTGPYSQELDDSFVFQCYSPMVMEQTLMDNVKSMACTFDRQIVLKNDGTLWSWGCMENTMNNYNGALGRNPTAADDLYDIYGMKPGQIEIDGNNSSELLGREKVC